MKRVLAVSGILVLLAGCSDPRMGQVADAADGYISGIQYHDAPGIIKHLASFRREIDAAPSEDWDDIRGRFVAEVEQRIASYDRAKTTGMLALEPDGIDLVLGLALGKGIFYHFDEVRLDEEGKTAVGRMEVVMDYAERRFQGLPPRSRVYLMGEPLGTLRTVTVGTEEEQEVRAISKVSLEWRFVWFDAVDVYPEGWAVESVQAIPETLEWVDLRRIF